MYFDRADYAKYGTQIKCNPAVKEARHKEALFEALLDDRLDIIATDHAPHTWEEKQGTYFNAPSGVPLVQHTLNVMLEFYQKGKISLEKIVEKMCHAPADCFNVDRRGFIREGYDADFTIIDMEKKILIKNENIESKCGWSPFNEVEFKGTPMATIISGKIKMKDGKILGDPEGTPLEFN